jgi:hypothetical protein
MPRTITRAEQIEENQLSLESCPVSGVSINDFVRLSGDIYIPAKADEISHSDVFGIAIDVQEDLAKIILAGMVDGYSGLVPGHVYYLSQTDGGKITDIEPQSGLKVPLGVAITETLFHFYHIGISSRSSSEQGAIVTTGINQDTTVICDSFSKISSYACVWDYTIKNGTNIRSGTVRACWNTNDEVSFDEVSNNDLGQTGKLRFNVLIVGTIVEITATVLSTGGNGWEVRLLRKNFSSALAATINAGETAIIDTFAKNSCYAMIVYYTAMRLDNLRVGTLNACWNSSDEVSWDDTSVNDLGQTDKINMSVGINGTNVEILGTVTPTGGDGWTVQIVKHIIN